MADPTDNPTPNDAIAPLLKAFEGYMKGFEEMIQSLGGQLRAPLWGQGTFGTFASPLQSLADQFAAQRQFVAAVQRMVQPATPMPAVGYFREYWIIGQRVQELNQAFERRYSLFLADCSSTLQQAQNTFQQRLVENPRLASSSLALFDAWTDCADEAHSQVAHSDAYAQMLADMCNLLSELKVERSKLSARIAQHLDLPSRSEVDHLHRELRDLKRSCAAASSRSAPYSRVRKK